MRQEVFYTDDRPLADPDGVPAGVRSLVLGLDGRPSTRKYRRPPRSTATPMCGPACRGSTTTTPTQRIWRRHAILAKVKTVGEKLGGEEAPFVPVDPAVIRWATSALTRTDGNW